MVNINSATQSELEELPGVGPVTAQKILAFRTENGAFTLDHFRNMASDWRFRPALTNTFLLSIIVVPIQIAMALGMAALVTGMGRGRDVVLYIWTIPLGISDLAAGLIWLAILEQNGFLNSFFFGLGLIDQPANWLTYQHPGLLFLAVVIAEIWRATAITMPRTWSRPRLPVRRGLPSINWCTRRSAGAWAESSTPCN